jgi:hypothetical protein
VTTAGPLDIKRWGIPARVRYAAYLSAFIAVVAAAWIHAVRPAFDPGTIVMPAFGLIIVIALVGLLSSWARFIDRWRHRPPPPGRN